MSGRAFLVKADVKAVLVLILVVDNVFAVGEIEVRIVGNVDHFVIAHSFARVAGPVSIVGHLDVRYRTTGVSGNSERLVELVNSNRGLPAALDVVGVKAETVLPDVSRRRKDLLPVAFPVALVHRNRGGRFVHSHSRDDENLLH